MLLWCDERLGIRVNPGMFCFVFRSPQHPLPNSAFGRCEDKAKISRLLNLQTMSENKTILVICDSLSQ